MDNSCPPSTKTNVAANRYYNLVANRDDYRKVVERTTKSTQPNYEVDILVNIPQEARPWKDMQRFVYIHTRQFYYVHDAHLDYKIIQVEIKPSEYGVFVLTLKVTPNGPDTHWPWLHPQDTIVPVLRKTEHLKDCYVKSTVALTMEQGLPDHWESFGRENNELDEIPLDLPKMPPRAHIRFAKPRDVRIALTARSDAAARRSARSLDALVAEVEAETKKYVKKEVGVWGKTKGLIWPSS